MRKCLRNFGWVAAIVPIVLCSLAPNCRQKEKTVLLPYNSTCGPQILGECEQGLYCAFGLIGSDEELAENGLCKYVGGCVYKDFDCNPDITPANAWIDLTTPICTEQSITQEASFACLWGKCHLYCHIPQEIGGLCGPISRDHDKKTEAACPTNSFCSEYRQDGTCILRGTCNMRMDCDPEYRPENDWMAPDDVATKVAEECGSAQVTYLCEQNECQFKCNG